MAIHRIAHRIRDMQTLPYCVVANRHFNDVYELYYEAFDKFRKVPEIRTLEENDSFCEVISDMLRKHLSVIPKLAMGILETSADEMIPAKELDGFMNAILRSVSSFIGPTTFFPREMSRHERKRFRYN